VRDLEKTYRDLVNWMVKHPNDVLAARQEIQFKLIKKRFVYGDSTMQTTLMPVFLKRESLERIRRTSEILDRVLEKIIRLYFEDDYVRSYYPIHFEVPRRWMHAETGYQRSTVINRHDILFDGKNLKYIEFNTDNPGGKGWTDLLEVLFRQHPLYKDLIDYSVEGDRPVLHGILRSRRTSSPTAHPSRGSRWCPSATSDRGAMKRSSGTSSSRRGSRRT
jgi:hypothetical protein